MPTYRLTTPGQPDELLEADSARVEGIHTVLRGTAYVMGPAAGGRAAASAKQRAGGAGGEVSSSRLRPLGDQRWARAGMSVRYARKAWSGPPTPGCMWRDTGIT